MIARTWRGSTRPGDADRYLDYLLATGVPELRETPDSAGVFVLRRAVDGAVEFVVLSLWNSLDAIRAFAGNDVDAAVYYPDDAAFLLGQDPFVTHHDVVVQA